MKKLLLTAVTTSALTLASLFSVGAQAADYKIDTDGAHAFVQFKIKHLGYSWLLGRFNTFDGEFSYDAAAPEKSEVEIVIETMKTEITEVHSEAGQQFKAKNVSNFEDVLFGGPKRLQEVGFKDRGIRAVF